METKLLIQPHFVICFFFNQNWLKRSVIFGRSFNLVLATNIVQKKQTRCLCMMVSFETAASQS